MNTGLQGKVALITGASRGIGKAIALAFASEGVRLALCARNEEQLKLTADEIQIHTHADVIAVKANMTKINDIRRFVATAVKKFDHIDILVNNAGGAHVGGLMTTTDEEWEYHLQLKLLGYIRMARETIPFMKKNSFGKIINIIGTAAKEPAPHFTVSGVTNNGLVSFTKSLSKELEYDHILVNGIHPGTTDTPLTEETFKSLAALFQKAPDEIKQNAIASLPQGRLGSPEDIAKVAVFLASDAANFVNGSVIPVDAGKILGV